MEDKSRAIFLLALVLACAGLFACEESLNPLSPEALEGDWTLLIYTDKVTGISYEPETHGFYDYFPLIAQSGCEPDCYIEVFYRLEFHTSSGISTMGMSVWLVPAARNSITKINICGTYLLIGATLTVETLNNEMLAYEEQTLSIQRDGARLTLEHDDHISVWGKL